MEDYAKEKVERRDKSFFQGIESDQISVISKSEAKDIITQHKELFGNLNKEQLQYHIIIQECILACEYAKAKLLVDTESNESAQDSFITHTPTPTMATFVFGEKVVTFYGLMRTSPDDNEGGYSNDGTSQFYQIMMSAKRYAELNKVTVNVKQIFLSVALSRHQGERALALGMLRDALVNDENDRGTTFVVATDSIRIGSDPITVSMVETMINYQNATLQFIATWGLVNEESVKTDDGEEERGVLIAAKEREDEMRQVVRDYGSSKNAGKSVEASPKGKEKQILIKKEQKKIRKTMATNTSITHAANLGISFMKHLGWKTEQRKNSEDNKKCVLGKFINKWYDEVPVKEGTDQAARKFTEFYEENKTDVNIDAFLRKNGISDIEELVASYARTTEKKMGYPDSQITMNCAAECILHEGNMPDITICDLGKNRDTIGNPGFVALMILACSGRVKHVVMTTPVRASSELKELDVMKELGDTLKTNTDDFYIFSECIGKDHNKLFRAEHNRREAISKAHETYRRKIAELVGKLSKVDKELYDCMKSIYESCPTRYIEDVAYEEVEEEEVDEESEGEYNEEE